MIKKLHLIQILFLSILLLLVVGYGNAKSKVSENIIEEIRGGTSVGHFVDSVCEQRNMPLDYDGTLVHAYINGDSDINNLTEKVKLIKIISSLLMIVSVIGFIEFVNKTYGVIKKEYKIGGNEVYSNNFLIIKKYMCMLTSSFLWMLSSCMGLYILVYNFPLTNLGFNRSNGMFYCSGVTNSDQILIYGIIILIISLAINMVWKIFERL